MAKREPEYKRLELFYQMLVHYLDRPYGNTELGKLLGTDRTNVWRIKEVMESLEIPVRESTEQPNKYFIPKNFQMRYIHFTPDEMATLYLGARRMQQNTKTSQQHVEIALRKLANALRKPFAENLIKAAGVILNQEQDAQQQEVLQTLTKCWLECIPVRIKHRVLHGTARDYIVHPYLLEPSVWGDGTYLIGFSEFHKGIATFKLARIEKAREATGPFRNEENFDVHTYLNHAWGIWHADNEPVIVRLKFSRWVTPRVKETIWHPQQTIVTNEDRSCIWETQVAQWKEMVPWVRGWGSDVEVLEPEELKTSLRNEARRLARMYGVGQGDDVDPKDAIAHTKNGDGERHNLVEHLHEVARLAAQFAEPFGGSELARNLGLWHDIGKFNQVFQSYLLDAEGDQSRKRRGPDHKAAGVKVAIDQKYKAFVQLLHGHHGGLRSRTNFDEWFAQKKEATSEAISAAQIATPEIFKVASLTVPEHIRKDPIAAEFFLRMLFSALVDADFLDTEQHFNSEKTKARASEFSIEMLWHRFKENQQALEKNAEPTPVNKVRGEIYADCLNAALLATGLFRLTVPTGGGKTRLSLGFGLRHALEHGLRQVIIVVPFITITEQTVKAYREILEVETDSTPVVLEHHSGAIEGGNNGDEHSPNAVWNRLSAENWDAPVVVTTTVQLFESLFANGTSHCRKLHRLAQSVIIIDEAQSLPIRLLDPILDGLRELCTNYGSTVVLSTATQPAFQEIDLFQQLDATEIIPNPERYFEQLSRVKYEWRLDTKPAWEEVAAWIQDEEQVLVILNTKKDAIALMDALNDPDVIHLSTLLCGEHRKRIIEVVRNRLKTGEPCRLVSTQVVEAGVDIDFPLVLRAFGPLDSIIQAAGRANREGKLEGKGRIIIFDPAEGGSPRGSYQIAKETTRTFLSNGEPNMDDPKSVATYFRLLYPLENTDEPGIQKLRKSMDYPEVSKNFRMIDSETVSIIVNYENAKEDICRLLENLQTDFTARRMNLRRLQPYMVSIFTSAAQKYAVQGLIAPLIVDDNDRILIGEWQGDYDDVRGLVIDDRQPDKFIF